MSNCPICDKETDPKYRPFCSKRCADVDLAKWLNGSYAIPGGNTDEEDGFSSDIAAEDPKIH
ncbi:DNA gyrase inhibitor YacG [Neptunicoccus sediminis]|uniref:DNA gyrase inhibitor YacG n=1 Tax=Neptunicoccus sediminis TaxID=1892596 RepID=UPI000845D59E|nr:DNA gyrase inhibitor YacG [Neptunicoccus sediminis]